MTHAAEIADKLVEAKPTQTPQQRRRPRVSVRSAVWNLANTVMGVGMLSLAGTMAQAGIGMSLGIICIFAVVTICSVMLLVDGAIATQASSYEELAHKALGTIGERYIQVCLLGSIASACVGFLVSVKDLAGFAVSAYTGVADDARHSDELLLLLVAAILAPMSLLRSLDAMQVTSFLSVLCLVWFVGVSVMTTPLAASQNWPCARLPDRTIDRTPAIFPKTMDGLLTALSIIMSSFICQTSVFPIWTEMRVGDASYGLPVQSTRRRFKVAVFITIGLCMAFYVLAALSGYLSWGEAVLQVDLVVQCYSPQSWYILLTYVGLTMVCLFSYPLFLFAGRSIVLRMLGQGDSAEAQYGIFAGVGFAILLASVLPALFVSNLGYVLAIGSAFVGPALTMEMPALCGLCLAEDHSRRVKCGSLLVVGMFLHFLVVLYCDY